MAKWFLDLYKKLKKKYEFSYHRFLRCVKIISELGELFVKLRDKPKLYDFVAIGTKTIDCCARIIEELRVDEVELSHWDYLNINGKTTDWALLPTIYGEIVNRSLKNKEKFLTAHVIAGEQTSYNAEYYDFRVIAIYNNTTEKLDFVAVRKHDLHRIKTQVCSDFWKTFQSTHIYYDGVEFVDDAIKVDNLIETTFIRDFGGFIQKFLDINHNNSYLLIGEPGMGKTMAVQYLINKMNFRTLRIPLKEIESGQARKHGLIDFLSLAMPDVVVIDDIDRASTSTQSHLLEFLDTHKHLLRVFIGTANNISNMISPLLRPGRFDEHIKVPFLEDQVIKTFLLDPDVSQEMFDWPIAYINHYNVYYRALGETEARKKIPEIKERIAQSRNAKYQ